MRLEMTLRDVTELCATIVASVGGSGLIVIGLSRYLGRIWADRALQSLRQEHSRANLEFQHQLDLITRKLQIELDAVAHLRKLRTDIEFEKLRDLWRRIAILREAFYAIPKAGGFIGYADSQEQANHWKKMSLAFVDSYSSAIQFLNEETLSIPKNIADESYVLLRIAGEEAAQSLLNPDPTDSAIANLGEKGLADFYLRRSRNLLDFLEKADSLQTSMRQFSDATGGATEAASPPA